MRKFGVCLMILTTFFLMNSCDNEPYDGPLNSPESNNPIELPDFQNTFSAKLDGQEFVEQHIYLTTSIDSNEENFIAITATKTDYHSIIIYLPLDVTVGTNHFSPESTLTNPNLNITYSNLENVLESGNGEGDIVILAHDIINHHIKGTFECVVNSQNGSTHHITNGSFDVIYN